MLVSAKTVPPLYSAELLVKLLIPVKFSELADAQIAPELYLELALFSKKVVFPVKVRVLLRVVRPHPNLYLPLNDLPPHWLHMHLVASASSGVAKLGHTGARALATGGCAPATGGCAPPVQALLKIIDAECTVINRESGAKSAQRF